MADLASIAERLDAIAEELTDLAMQSLRDAIGSGGQADDRRLGRARRSVEKAAALLRERHGAEP